MREIKFRVWNAKDGWYFPSGEEPALKSNGELDCELGFYDCLVVEQHTGLKDKNGVEIYEGDLWESPDGNTIEVLWISEEDGNDWTGWNIGYTETMSSGKVVGNIHEGNFKDNSQDR